MNFNPSPDSEVQGLHVSLGALFVTLPAALWAIHPTWNFCFGHPCWVGTWIGLIYASVKEFVWDQNIEDAVTRGSNWKDFVFYVVGILAADLILWV